MTESSKRKSTKNSLGCLTPIPVQETKKSRQSTKITSDVIKQRNRQRKGICCHNLSKLICSCRYSGSITNVKRYGGRNASFYGLVTDEADESLDNEEDENHNADQEERKFYWKPGEPRRHWCLRTHCEQSYFPCRCAFLKIPSQLGRFLWFQYTASCKPDKSYIKKFVEAIYKRTYLLIRDKTKLDSFMLFDYMINLMWLDYATRKKVLTALETFFSFQDRLQVVGLENALLPTQDVIRLLLSLAIGAGQSLKSLYLWYVFKRASCPLIGYFPTYEEYAPYLEKPLIEKPRKIKIPKEKKDKLTVINLTFPSPEEKVKFLPRLRRSTIEPQSDTEIKRKSETISAFDVYLVDQNQYLQRSGMNKNCTSEMQAQTERYGIDSIDVTIFQTEEELLQLGENETMDELEMNWQEEFFEVPTPTNTEEDEFSGEEKIGKDSKDSMQSWMNALVISGLKDNFSDNDVDHGMKENLEIIEPVQILQTPNNGRIEENDEMKEPFAISDVEEKEEREKEVISEELEEEEEEEEEEGEEEEEEEEEKEEEEEEEEEEAIEQEIKENYEDVGEEGEGEEEADNVEIEILSQTLIEDKIEEVNKKDSAGLFIESKRNQKKKKTVGSKPKKQSSEKIVSQHSSEIKKKYLNGEQTSKEFVIQSSEIKTNDDNKTLIEEGENWQDPKLIFGNENDIDEKQSSIVGSETQMADKSDLDSQISSAVSDYKTVEEIQLHRSIVSDESGNQVNGETKSNLKKILRNSIEILTDSSTLRKPVERTSERINIESNQKGSLDNEVTKSQSSESVEGSSGEISSSFETIEELQYGTTKVSTGSEDTLQSSLPVRSPIERKEERLNLDPSKRKPDHENVSESSSSESSGQKTSVSVEIKQTLSGEGNILKSVLSGNLIKLVELQRDSDSVASDISLISEKPAVKEKCDKDYVMKDTDILSKELKDKESEKQLGNKDSKQTCNERNGIDTNMTKEFIKKSELKKLYFPLKGTNEKHHFIDDPVKTLKLCYDYLIKYRYSNINIFSLRMLYRISLAGFTNLTKLCVNFGYLADGTGDTLLSIGAIREGKLRDLKLLCLREELPTFTDNKFTPEMFHDIPDLAWRKARILCPCLCAHFVLLCMPRYNVASKFLTKHTPLVSFHLSTGYRGVRAHHFQLWYFDMTLKMLGAYSETLVALSFYIWHSRERLDNLVKKLLATLVNLQRFEYYGTLQYIKTIEDICNYFLNNNTKLNELAIFKIEDPCSESNRLAEEIENRRIKFEPFFKEKKIKFNLGTFSL